MISISKYFDIEKIFQNCFFDKSCLPSVLTPFYGRGQHQTAVFRNIAIFVVRGAYLGHFAYDNFRQIVEISGMVEISDPHITSKECSSVE